MEDSDAAAGVVCVVGGGGYGEADGGLDAWGEG